MELNRIARFLSSSQADGISVSTLAKRLGVSFATAKRRLEQYAKANGYSLEGERARVSKTGPLSVVWRLVPARPGPLAVVKDTIGRTQLVEKKAPAPQPPPPLPPLPRLPELPLPLKPETIASLTPDENGALQFLLRYGTARVTELSRYLNRGIVRTDGLMRALIRKLHAAGTPLYDDEKIPSGETLYRVLPGIEPLGKQ